MGRLHETGESLVANLLETETWESSIYQLETVDPVQGGADGIDNLQAKQLANRTTYLKGFMEAIQAAQSGHEAAADPHAQYVEKAGDVMTGALTVDVAGVDTTILSLGSDLGVNTRRLDIKSPATDSVSGAFVFQTSNSFKFSIDSDKSFRIDEAGDTFIENPSPKLTLKDNNSISQIDASGFIDFVDSADGRLGYFGFASSSDANLFIRNECAGGTLRFYTEGLVRVSIDENGNMGIGSTSPSAALDVEGTVRIGTNSATTKTDLQFTDNPNIAATSSMRFYTDSDNTGTGVVFDWLTNGGNTTDGDPLMRLYDSGELLIGYTVDQGAYKLQVNGAAYFAGDLWIHASAGRTDVIVDADSGYDSWLHLREAGVDSLLIKNDATASESSIEKLNSAGSATVGAITFDESGNINVPTGTLKQNGVEVATLQSLLDGVGLGKSLGANGYATLPGGLIVQWGLTTTLTAEGSQTITLPIVWPTGGFVAHATPIRSNPTANATVAAGATLVGTNQITVVLDHYNSAAASGVYWIAIGW